MKQQKVLILLYVCVMAEKAMAILPLERLEEWGDAEIYTPQDGTYIMYKGNHGPDAQPDKPSYIETHRVEAHHVAGDRIDKGDVLSDFLVDSSQYFFEEAGSGHFYGPRAEGFITYKGDLNPQLAPVSDYLTYILGPFSSQSRQESLEDFGPESSWFSDAIISEDLRYARETSFSDNESFNGVPFVYEMITAGFQLFLPHLGVWFLQYLGF